MNSAYCPLPFKHAFVDSTGVSACCASPRHKITLKDWPTSKPLLEMQQQISNNQIPKACEQCHKHEQQFGHSIRTSALRDYSNQQFVTTDIDFVDYRSSNICNFKCRSCEPMFSHGIAQEAKQNAKLKKFFKLETSLNKTETVETQDRQWIIDQLPHIKRLMLTGGEPTMIPGLKDIVKLIADQHADTVTLIITSNLSFQDDFWLDITKRLPNLHWTASIDATGPAAEIIRHGTNWAVVEQNLRWLATNAGSLNINTVVTNNSLFHLREVLELARQLQYQSKHPQGRHGDQGLRHQFSVVTRPNILAADNLSPEMVPQALEYLQQCASLDLDNEQRDTVLGLIHTMENYHHDRVLWQQSCEYNSTLDQLRQENHKQLYPGVFN